MPHNYHPRISRRCERPNYRKHLLVILHRMVCFYRAEAYHVAVFSAVKTARKASEALDKVCGEVRMEN